MLVSAILVGILLAGGYMLFLWVRQHRGSVDSAVVPRRSLTSEREKRIQPIDLNVGRRQSVDPLADLPSARADSRAPTHAPSPVSPTRAHVARGETRPVPEMTAAVAAAARRSAKTQPEVVIEPGQAQRRVRRRDPTMQISAADLAEMMLDDEGTTLGVGADDEAPRARVSMMQTDVDLTVEVALPDDDEASGPFTPVTVSAAGATDVGKKRKHNEDAIAMDHARSLYVLADGMGGYAAGEVASQMCVDTILRAYATGSFGGESIPGLPPRGDELVRAVQTANQEILAESRANEARAGMGTTVVALCLVPERQRAYIAHVGDSRLYRLRRDELTQMTTDHTLGAQGVTGPAAQKLSRAIGVFDEVEVDLNIDVPEPGDVYLICSDGLFKMLHELRIVELLAERKDPQSVANTLVAEANARGGKDNISVIVLRIAPGF